MKKYLSSFLLAVASAFTAGATVSSTSVDNLFAPIPDGRLTGYQNSQTLSGLPASITDINVTLNISGGFNGDLYAYLAHGNAVAILLNRVGRTSSSNVGYPDTGFGLNASVNSFTLDDQAAHDIHSYRTFPFTLNGNGQLTGLWQPDGRTLDPLSAGSAFSGAARSNTLGIFNGMDPNGLWTLFVADVSPGAESTLIGWGLEITTIPEPNSIMLTTLGLAAGWLWAGGRRRRKVKTFPAKQ
jgi:subtilisin-like proprotein convertase family protein